MQLQYRAHSQLAMQHLKQRSLQLWLMQSQEGAAKMQDQVVAQQFSNELNQQHCFRHLLLHCREQLQDAVQRHQSLEHYKLSCLSVSFNKWLIYKSQEEEISWYAAHKQQAFSIWVEKYRSDCLDQQVVNP